MAETKKSAIARKPVKSRVSGLDIREVRPEEGKKSKPVLEALICTHNTETKKTVPVRVPSFVLKIAC